MTHVPIEQQIEEAAEKSEGILRSRFGLWALGGISFVESALIVPLATDPFLVAYILANRASALRAVVVATLMSTVGGVFAFVVAFTLYEHLLAGYMTAHFGREFFMIVEEFSRGTFLVAFVGTLAPLPYTLVAMAAGFSKGSIVAFILGSLLGRLLRFGVVGVLTYWYGHQALQIARRQMPLVIALSIVTVIVYFYLAH